MKSNSFSDIETVALDDVNCAIIILDQTLLPNTIKTVSLHTQEEIWQAIHSLMVRGAPAIGITAAMGIYLAAKEIAGKQKFFDFSAFYPQFCKAKEYLSSSRPTAVNLFWALNRMEKKVLSFQNATMQSMSEVMTALRMECEEIKNEDIRVCKQIGENGLTLLHDGDGILTHCNAGRLAAVQYGTATAPIYLGTQKGFHFHVFADETRPLLQGARLTAFELQASGIDVTLICDNMCASVMKKGWVNAVFVGCDRVAANGDTANKIGTSVVAAVANHYHIPVYICAPTATIDMKCPSGDHIPIEQRNPEEVTEMWYQQRMAPSGIKVYNPAFDVTEHELITAIITEYGIATPPYQESFQKIFADKKRECLVISDLS